MLLMFVPGLDENHVCKIRVPLVWIPSFFFFFTKSDFQQKKVTFGKKNDLF